MVTIFLYLLGGFIILDSYQEIYREVSSESFDRKVAKYIVLLAIFSLTAWEGSKFLAGGGSISGFLFCFVFLGLWIWRTVFWYTYILTDKEFIVLSHGLGITKKFVADLSMMESYTNKYQKSFFKGAGIKYYAHRYSSIDPNTMRLLVLNKSGKLSGVLFKSSDKMISRLKRLAPDKFLPLE